MDGGDDFTVLLERYQQGDARAADRLVPLVHDELHRLAHRILSRSPPGRTLQTTDLLNEAWIRLDRGREGYSGREHFLAVAARAMRSIVVDRARRRGAERRGGNAERVDLDLAVDVLEAAVPDLVELDAALEELARVRPTLARVVELRFFAGMSHPDIARVTGASLRTVERDWSTARAWLFARLEGAEGFAP